MLLGAVDEEVPRNKVMDVAAVLRLDVAGCVTRRTIKYWPMTTCDFNTLPPSCCQRPAASSTFCNEVRVSCKETEPAVATAEPNTGAKRTDDNNSLRDSAWVR